MEQNGRGVAWLIVVSACFFFLMICPLVAKRA